VINIVVNKSNVTKILFNKLMYPLMIQKRIITSFVLGRFGIILSYCCKMFVTFNKPASFVYGCCHFLLVFKHNKVLTREVIIHSFI